MNETRWQRMACASGIVYFILAFVAFVLFEVDFPSIGDSADQVRSFIDESGSKLEIQSALGLMSVVFLLWWVGAVRATIARVEGGTGLLAGIAFAGGVSLAILLVASVGIQGQVLFTDFNELQPTDGTLEAIPLMFIIGGGLIGVTTAARAVFFGAIGFAALRHRAFPIWTGWVSIVLSLGAFVGNLAPTQIDVFDGIWFIAFILSFFWILILSIVMMVRVGKTSGSVPA